jgi:hypothetical protein
MIRYVGNVGIIVDMEDICPPEPKMFPCATECDWTYIRDETNGIEYKECTKCKQKIILEFRV